MTKRQVWAKNKTKNRKVEKFENRKFFRKRFHTYHVAVKICSGMARGVVNGSLCLVACTVAEQVSPTLPTSPTPPNPTQDIHACCPRALVPDSEESGHEESHRWTRSRAKLAGRPPVTGPPRAPAGGPPGGYYPGLCQSVGAVRRADGMGSRFSCAEQWRRALRP